MINYFLHTTSRNNFPTAIFPDENIPDRRNQSNSIFIYGNIYE